MRAVVTVIGKNAVGILADVSGMCAKYNADVVEVSQTLLQEMFAMIMLIDLTKMEKSLSEFQEQMDEMGKKRNLKIHVMHEDIFNSMHTI